MVTITESDKIAHVYLVQLKRYEDERGYFMETFRKSWFPQRRWDIIQTNRSESKAGVLRGLHFHRHQVDYWYVPQGSLQVGLVDIRRGSPTFMATQLVTMDANTPLGLYIPSGVAHGFAALTAVTLTYLVDNYYDSTDEFGVAWNDPALGLDWGVKAPIVSGRDAANPCLGEIPAGDWPHYEPEPE